MWPSSLFDAAYRAASTPALRAAGAFWAGHVAQRGGDRGGFAVWMRRAALEGGTFYGRIARRALGPAIACAAGGTIGNADLEALLGDAAGTPCLRSAAGGREPLAEAELRALWLDTARDGVFDRSIMLAARAVGFTQLAAEIEQRGVPRPNGAGLTRLRPASGFLVDPPLVYALVRREFDFDAGAVSSSGARGLMQIMPATAQAVAGGRAGQLQDPAVNLAIGQQYLLALAEDDVIDGDLIRILASYGQGQGGAAQMGRCGARRGRSADVHRGDPQRFTRRSFRTLWCTPGTMRRNCIFLRRASMPWRPADIRGWCVAGDSAGRVHEDGGMLMPDITIPARRGKAAFVAAGQVIRVINTHGEQVVDTWAFNRHDMTEFMSMEHSRAGCAG